MRTLLVLIFALALSQPALAAAPTIDVSGATRTNQHLGATVSALVTTTSTNDAIIVMVANVLTASGATVTGIVGTGGCSTLSFARLASVAVTGSPNVARLNMEVWSAPSAAALTACSLTISMSASTQDVINVETFGIHGLASLSSPLDTNVGAVSCVSSVATTPTAPTLTTSQANDLLMGFGYTVDIGVPKQWTPATWTSLYDVRDNVTGATWNTDFGASYKAVSATQTATSVDLTTPAGNAFPSVECGLAFTADAATTANHNGLLLMGVG